PLEILSKYEEMFEHVIVIPDLAGMASHGVVTTDMGGMLGLQVQHRLLDPGRMAVERCLDLFFIALASPLLLLLTAIVAVLIKLDSPGPVFYGHRRIGRGGEKFTCWKFRSMVHNANEVLAKYLDEHPELRQEWERKRKLRNDPR